MFLEDGYVKVETKADPLSLESLVSWLETMPSDRAYDYLNCNGRCLYGQYMKAHGIKWKESGASSPRLAPEERNRFCALVYEHVAEPSPWTFGAALTRAREALGRIRS